MKRGSLIILLLLGVFLIGIISVLPTVSADHCGVIMKSDSCFSAGDSWSCQGVLFNIGEYHKCFWKQDNIGVNYPGKCEIDRSTTYDCFKKNIISKCLGSLYEYYNGPCDIDVYTTMQGNTISSAFCEKMVVDCKSELDNSDAYCQMIIEEGTGVFKAECKLDIKTTPYGKNKNWRKLYSYLSKSKPLFFKTILAILLIILVLVAIIYFKPRSINKRNKNKKGRR